MNSSTAGSRSRRKRLIHLPSQGQIHLRVHRRLILDRGIIRNMVLLRQRELRRPRHRARNTRFIRNFTVVRSRFWSSCSGIKSCAQYGTQRSEYLRCRMHSATPLPSQTPPAYSNSQTTNLQLLQTRSDAFAMQTSAAARPRTDSRHSIVGRSRTAHPPSFASQRIKQPRQTLRRRSRRNQDRTTAGCILASASSEAHAQLPSPAHVTPSIVCRPPPQQLPRHQRHIHRHKHRPLLLRRHQPRLNPAPGPLSTRRIFHNRSKLELNPFDSPQSKHPHRIPAASPQRFPPAVAHRTPAVALSTPIRELFPPASTNPCTGSRPPLKPAPSLKTA